MSLEPVTHEIFQSLHRCKPQEHTQHFSIAAWAYNGTPPAYRLFCGCGLLLDFVASTSFAQPWIAVHEDRAIVYSHAEVAAMKAEMDTLKEASERCTIAERQRELLLKTEIESLKAALRAYEVVQQQKPLVKKSNTLDTYVYLLLLFLSIWVWSQFGH